MQVRVELPEVLDVDEHARANARDEAPDRTPYGLHRLAEDDDVSVSFRRPLRDPRLATVARRVRNRLGAHEVVPEVLGAYARERRAADVVLCSDERTAVPAALVPAGPPVVSNIIWIRRPETYPAPQRALLGRALRRMGGIYAQAHSVVDELREGWADHGLNPERVHFVRLGVDPDYFPVQPWTEGSLTVASVGDDPYRDHPLLVEAVRRVREGGLPATLELGTTQPGIELPDAGMGVLHRCRMEGAVRAMYRRAGVVAVALTPSNRGSGSTVVLEAAASARPVVVTHNPAMADLVGTDGSRGLLVDPGDPSAFADALRELLSDPERAREMGRNARAWLEANHTTTHMAADIRAVLDATVA